MEKGSYRLNADDPFDMDVRAAANEIALRGDPEAAIEYLVFAQSMDTVVPVKIPTVTFSKKDHADMEVSPNAASLIDALIKSGYKIS